jgi:CRISPR/Cas system-associated protein Cas5 (RAMP superfamily)
VAAHQARSISGNVTPERGRQTNRRTLGNVAQASTRKYERDGESYCGRKLFLIESERLDVRGYSKGVARQMRKSLGYMLQKNAQEKGKLLRVETTNEKDVSR